MNTCKDCRYWKAYSEIDNILGDCSHPKLAYAALEYDNSGIAIRQKNAEGEWTYDENKLSFNDPSSNAGDMLIYWDDEGYEAEFMTGRDFGCVHWTAADMP
jgi:hypothetical protein